VKAGLFFPVTLLDNPPAEAAYVIRENFGPLRAVIKYKDVYEAVRLANGTPYGLEASRWGTDPASRLLATTGIGPPVRRFSFARANWTSSIIPRA
jgi:acyl-CoA reductase-like NAD-dependent aldehyde dehydrogenase